MLDYDDQYDDDHDDDDEHDDDDDHDDDNDDDDGHGVWAERLLLRGFQELQSPFRLHALLTSADGCAVRDHFWA